MPRFISIANRFKVCLRDDPVIYYFAPCTQLSTRGKIIFRALCNVRYSATQYNMWDFKDSVAMGDVRFFARLSSSPTSRQFWSFVKKLRKSSSMPSLSDSGSLVYFDSSKANLLNDFFCSCFNSSCPVLPSTHLGPAPSPCPPELLCSEEQVLQLLLNLSSDSASGPDAISSRMLKSTASSIAYPLSHIFNLSLQSGILPSDWKHSHIVPIPKTKSPSSSPSDYRPISLLPIISKVLERHVYNFIFDFCNRHDVISNSQFGFPLGSPLSLLSSLSPTIVFLCSIHAIQSVPFSLICAKPLILFLISFFLILFYWSSSSTDLLAA